MSMNFVIGTTIVVLVIFAFFFYAAHKADQVVAEKARLNQKTKK